MKENSVKERSLIISIGILLYVIMSVVDRFIVSIPDWIYIPIAILGIALIIIGFIKSKKVDK